MIPVQVGGGIRIARVDRRRCIEDGAARAILGTAGRARPCVRGARRRGVRRARRRRGRRARRARDGATAGRRKAPSSRTTIAALDEAGAPRYLVTSIARDGTLDGPDLRLYTQVLKLTETPLIASGGVRDADDIWALRDLGCEAAVTGKALYEKTLKLAAGDPGLTDDARQADDPVPRRRRRARREGHEVPGPARRGRPRASWPRTTTARAPTSWSSSTSRPPSRAGRRRST